MEDTYIPEGILVIELLGRRDENIWNCMEINENKWQMIKIYDNR